MIRRLAEPDLDAVVAVALRAWAPVFAAFEEAMGPPVFRAVFPDWQASQERAVRAACTGVAWVATRGGVIAGFATAGVHDEGAARAGELEMLAVDPQHQRKGLGASLIREVERWFLDQGCALAVIATGGDPGHAPARAAYERAGYAALPQVRYYKRVRG